MHAPRDSTNDDLSPAVLSLIEPPATKRHGNHASGQKPAGVTSYEVHHVASRKWLIVRPKPIVSPASSNCALSARELKSQHEPAPLCARSLAPSGSYRGLVGIAFLTCITRNARVGDNVLVASGR